MPTATRAEYLELDGIPLTTAAWEVTDLSPLWDVAPYRGDDQLVPYRRGVLPFRRTLGAKRVDLPFNIYGDADSDGNPATAGQERAQLYTNRLELVRDVLRPRIISATGDSTVRYYLPDGSTIAGPGKVIGGLNPVPLGPSALTGSLSLSLSEGGLRSETATDVTSASVPDAGSLDFTVPNPGGDYQDELLITLAGTANAVTLTNLTADPAGDVFLTFGGDISPGVVLDTSNYTAIRSAVSVIGLVTYSGFERWLPLVPGDNTIRIEPTGGSATVQFTHYPFHP